MSLQGFKDRIDLGITWPVDSDWEEQSKTQAKDAAQGICTALAQTLPSCNMIYTPDLNESQHTPVPTRESGIELPALLFEVLHRPLPC